MLKAYVKGTNKEVKQGDFIKTHSGETMIFDYASRKTEIGKSGKIITATGRELYAHIFNLEIRDVEEKEITSRNFTQTYYALCKENYYEEVTEFKFKAFDEIDALHILENLKKAYPIITLLRNNYEVVTKITDED